MRIPRLLLRRFLIWLSVLVASLLFLLWGAPVAAQIPASPPSAPAAKVPFGNDRTLVIPPIGQHGFNVYSGASGGLHALPAPRITVAQAGAQAANNERCYALRDYRFTHGHVGSDATKFSGSSTCEPANQFRPKTIR